jgi:hypothetical protein
VAPSLPVDLRVLAAFDHRVALGPKHRDAQASDRYSQHRLFRHCSALGDEGLLRKHQG